MTDIAKSVHNVEIFECWTRFNTDVYKFLLKQVKISNYMLELSYFFYMNRKKYYTYIQLDNNVEFETH